MMNRKGVTTIEFALIAPVIIIILFCAIEFTNVFRAQAKVNAATGVLAMLIAAQATVTAPSGSLANLCTGAAFNLAPYPRAAISADIASITNDHPSNRVSGSSDATTVNTYLDWENISSCSANAPSAMSLSGAFTLANSPSSLLTRSGAPAASNANLAYSYSVIVVQTRYQYSNVLSFLLGRTVTLSGTAIARPRSNVTVQCTNVAGNAACPALQ